jgi:RNA polymerase sigma-70 factor (ECF subfamily)
MIPEKEYKEAVKEYTKNIFRFLFKSLRDEEACKDIIQDCFLKLWQNRDRVDKTKVKSWLFSVAHNAMINYLKKSNRNTSLENSDGKTQVYQQHNFELKTIIDNALNQLPAIQKSIILLRDLEGYEYKEIATILSITEAQVKVYLFRARLKVKNVLISIQNVL